MTKSTLFGGVIHPLPNDLNKVLTKTTQIINLWQGLTQLARNEFICWVESPKQDKTRAKRIDQTVEELLEGKKRPCCWVGCIHRIEKKPSKWQQNVLIDKNMKPLNINTT